MQTHLNQITHWLKSNANDIYESLQPPVSDDDLKALESLIGKALPDDFKTLYRWHNGQDKADTVANFVGTMVFLGLGRIIAQYTANMNDDNYRQDIADFLSDNDDIDKKVNPQGFVSKPSWLPFMSDYSRCSLYVDLQEGELGKFGRVIFVDLDYDMAFVVADSIFELIKTFAEDLQAGRYQLSQELLSQRNLQFLEADASIDLINWQWSKRYKRGE